MYFIRPAVIPNVLSEAKIKIVKTRKQKSPAEKVIWDPKGQRNLRKQIWYYA